MNVARIFRREENDACRIHQKRGLEHEAGEIVRVAEVDVRRRGPTLADFSVFCESAMERAEVISQSAVMKPGPSTAKMRMSRVLQVRHALIAYPCLRTSGMKFVLWGERIGSPLSG